MEEDVKLIPPQGVYAISLVHCHSKYKGMLNIKKHNDRNSVTVEVHLFNHNSGKDLREKIATVYFHKRMRDELSLNDEKSFKLQLDSDKEEIENLIY
jgi:riboflavin kinase/FMN adenylyltransferase